ncbi:hypothetical protein K402DRAFT_389372 [Aulographum hederae CBS 113979]|uniref:Uncharacterized protein n=1 Tax=Aulographum hederae CBS 113979 TaxID=1176131 RepID=A0A6G1HDT0_9PEZI|nr:hypothetical protein K402DRAFT_389372 [Aulographum hederae CBS 113979]
MESSITSTGAFSNGQSTMSPGYPLNPQAAIQHLPRHNYGDTDIPWEWPHHRPLESHPAPYYMPDLPAQVTAGSKERDGGDEALPSQLAHPLEPLGVGMSIPLVPAASTPSTPQAISIPGLEGTGLIDEVGVQAPHAPQAPSEPSTIISFPTPEAPSKPTTELVRSFATPSTLPTTTSETSTPWWIASWTSTSTANQPSVRTVYVTPIPVVDAHASASPEAYAGWSGDAAARFGVPVVWAVVGVVTTFVLVGMGL